MFAKTACAPLCAVLAVACAVFAAACAFFVAACGGGSGHDCQAVGKAYSALVEKQIAREYEGEELLRARQALPGVTAKLVEVCRAKEWSLEERRCIIKAKRADDLEQCHHAGATK